jgi:hypothetical protein
VLVAKRTEASDQRAWEVVLASVADRALVRQEDRKAVADPAWAGLRQSVQFVRFAEPKHREPTTVKQPKRQRQQSMQRLATNAS